MFRKIDNWIDKSLEHKWVRVTIFTLLMVNTIVACIGWIVLGLMCG